MSSLSGDCKCFFYSSKGVCVEVYDGLLTQLTAQKSDYPPGNHHGSHF